MADPPVGVGEDLFGGVDDGWREVDSVDVVAGWLCLLRVVASTWTHQLTIKTPRSYHNMSEIGQ